MDCSSPVIYLLSAGADPTDSIEGLARKKKTDVACVSMGEVIWAIVETCLCMGMVEVLCEAIQPIAIERLSSLTKPDAIPLHRRFFPTSYSCRLCICCMVCCNIRSTRQLSTFVPLSVGTPTRAQQGQSVVASRAIAAATGNGSWVLLQNCHLGLDYMETMEDYVQVLSTTNNVACKKTCLEMVSFLRIILQQHTMQSTIPLLRVHGPIPRWLHTWMCPSCSAVIASA